MGAYTPEAVALNSLLTQYGIGYRSVGLVGTALCPRVPVPQQFGSYPIFLKDNWLRPINANKAPGEKPRATSFTMSATSYATNGYQVAEVINSELLDTADPVNMLARSAEHILDTWNIAQEIRIRDAAWTNVGSTASMTGGASVASAAAIAQNALVQTTGLRANVAVVPIQTFNQLNTRADVQAHGIGANARERMASILGVDTLLIPSGVYNAGQESQANAITSIWSTSILFCYVPVAAGPNVPSYLVSVFWNGPKVTGTTPAGAIQIATTNDVEQGVWRTWCRAYTQEICTARELGFLVATGL